MKKSLKNKTKLIPLAILIAGGVCGCAPTTSTVVTTITENGGNLIWSASSAEKIYLDKDISLYEGIRGEKRVDIIAFKGEHEAKQLIITPENDVTWFDANASELVSQSGASIPSSNITIYAEKYLKMNQIFDTLSTAPLGRVPDGLVPVKNSLAYHDNKITAHQNQALYIDVNVPVTQEAGIYSGTVEVIIDGLIYKVPMTVNVLDIAVNQELHSRSVFLDHWQFWNGELDMSQDMIDKYHTALAEFGLSPQTTVLENELTFTDEGMNYYVDKTYEMLQNPKFTTICIPYQVGNYQGKACFREDVMKKYLRLFWKKSVDNNFNMFKYLVTYFGAYMDEPDDFGNMDVANVSCDRFKVCISEIVEEFNSTDTSHPMHDEFVESVAKIPQIVTSRWTKESDGHIETYAPKVNFYDDPASRANYDFQKEKWWYTCVLPRMPYPTYHTEDTLSSARMLSWMASNYDVVGNLFWSTNIYAQIAEGNAYLPISNYYTGRADRYWSCNGDGYLFYPGKQYGYDGPLPSLRLEAIRDGNEEYEVLYNLKEKIKSLELDDKAVFFFLTNGLYDGTKVIGGSSLMERARLALANLTLAGNNGSDFAISKFEIGDKELNAEFYAKNGSVIKVNGETLTEGESYKDGHKFIYTHSLTEGPLELEISLTYNEEEIVISNYIAGKHIIYEASELKDLFSAYGASVSTSMTSAGKLGELVKIDVGATKNKRQTIKFDAPFASLVNRDLRKIQFNFYHPSTTKMIMSFGCKKSDGKADSYLIENYELTKGMNTLTLDAANIKLGDSFNVDYYFFSFGNSSSKTETEKSIQLQSILVVEK